MSEKDKATRPNYVITIVVSDDGRWPRIDAKNLCPHVGIKLPSGLTIESMVASEHSHSEVITALVEAQSVIEDMRSENKLHGHITDASARYLHRVKPRIDAALAKESQ